MNMTTDPPTPTIIWKTEITDGLEGLSVGFGRIIVLTGQCELICLDPGDGSTTWRSGERDLYTSSNIAVWSDGQKFRVWSPWNFDLWFEPAVSTDVHFLPIWEQPHPGPCDIEEFRSWKLLEPDPSLDSEEVSYEYDETLFEPGAEPSTYMEHLLVFEPETRRAVFSLFWKGGYSQFHPPWRISPNECILGTSNSEIIKVRFPLPAD